MRAVFCFLFCFLMHGLSQAQYAPQAGLPGSTAISAGSSQIVAWATQCTVQRGFMDITNPPAGYASAGDSSLAVGPADRNIVSLGDSGIAVLTFEKPIFNGPGADFAVFENGFLNTANNAEAFLELAFVEVSSDGINYFRFPASSLTQYNTQVGNGNYLNAANLDNLAGKYLAMYGTPFDLQELSGTPGLDINSVTHVRLVDVVGSISANASRDHMDRIINDPYPTPFPSCGFDLDAVGVINRVETSVPSVNEYITINIYPNPVTDHIVVDIKNGHVEQIEATLLSITGVVLQQTSIDKATQIIPMGQYPAGMYYLVLHDTNGNKWAEKITKR